MFTPSATKQFAINQLPDDPSQISSASFTDGGTVINYRKVGKLYFGFYAAGNDFVIGDGVSGPGLAQTTARIAAKLGITINTTYSRPVGSSSTQTYTYYTGSGTVWSSQSDTASVTQLFALLAN